MTVKTPIPPALPDELERLLRRLRLPYVRRAAPEVIATANSQRWEHAEVLRVLLSEEAAGRDRATIQTRRRASGLPAGKTFDAWEANASVIPKASQQALRTLEWVDRAETLCICGPSGTGKSHFIEALGHHAIDHGKTVAWHTLETLAHLFRRHQADDSVHKAISKLIRSDLILIDDIGLDVYKRQVYDLAADEGWVNVGITADTAPFAVKRRRRGNPCGFRLRRGRGR